MAKFLKDLGKTLKDLLEKGYPEAKAGAGLGIKVETSLKTPNDVTFKTTGTREAGNNSVKGVVEPEWKVEDKGLTLSGKFTTAAEMELSAALSNKLADGTKFKGTLKVKDTSDELDATGVFNAEFKNDNVAVNGFVEQPISTKPAAKFGVDGVFCKDGTFIGVGGSASYKDEFKPDSLNVKIEVTGDDYSALFFNENKLGDKPSSVVGFGYNQKVSDALSGGVDFSFNADDENLNPRVRFGVEKATAGGATLKSRLQIVGTNELTTSLSYKRGFSESGSFTLGSDLNALKLFGSNQSGDAHRFSLTLSFLD
jgi:hypothetical protein